MHASSLFIQVRRITLATVITSAKISTKSLNHSTSGQVADVKARQRLRSSSSSSLIVSRTRLSTVGDRAFPVAAARVWNSLPEHVTSAPSVAVLRSRLKTHLFDVSHPDPV